MKLRDYQKKAIKEIQNCSSKKIILNLVTGGGKSVVIAEIARITQKYMNVIVLTTFSALISQLDRHLQEFGIEANIIKDKYHRTTGNNVYLIMEQSFHKKVRKQYKFDSVVLLKDEAIGIGGERYNAIKRDLGIKKEIVFSATPYNDKNEKFEDYKYIKSLTLPESIRQGWSTSIKWFIPTFIKDINFEEMEQSYFDYTQVGIEEEFKDSTINSKTISLINNMKGQTLVFCANISHSEHIAKQLNNVGIVHSKIDEKTNEKTIEKFKNKEIKILVSVSSLTIGFDAPNVENLVIIRPTKRQRLFEQIVGRGVRLYKEKQFVNIYDLGRNLERFGRIDVYEFDKRFVETNFNEMQTIKYMLFTSKKEIVEINNNINEVKIKLDKYIKTNMPKTDIKYIYILLKEAKTVKEILVFGRVYYERKTNLSTGGSEKILKRWEKLIFKEIPMNMIGMARAMLKTRIVNITKDKKKWYSLYYFADFVKKQTGGNYMKYKQSEPPQEKQEARGVIIDVNEDNEIPF